MDGNLYNNDLMDDGESEFVVQPYMFEPEPVVFHPESSTDVSDSDWSESDEENDNNHFQTRLQSLDWCSCNNCSVMSTSAECKCCNEYDELKDKLEGFSCITQHPGFLGNCLNPDVIEVSFFEFLQSNGPVGDDEEIHEKYRYVAYRRLARWIWHRLSKNDRRILPACAVTAIRRQFPSEEFTGFKYVREI